MLRVNAKDVESGGRLTDLGRVVGRLGIEPMRGTPPQAEGRVERALPDLAGSAG